MRYNLLKKVWLLREIREHVKPELILQVSSQQASARVNKKLALDLSLCRLLRIMKRRGEVGLVVVGGGGKVGVQDQSKSYASSIRINFYCVLSYE